MARKNKFGCVTTFVSNRALKRVVTES